MHFVTKYQGAYKYKNQIQIQKSDLVIKWFCFLDSNHELSILSELRAAKLHIYSHIVNCRVDFSDNGLALKTNRLQHNCRKRLLVIFLTLSGIEHWRVKQGFSRRSQFLSG